MPPISDPERLRDYLAALDRAERPSIALYEAVLAHGPEQLRMLAANALGMAYVNIVVRARNAIPASPDGMPSPRHHALEPMLAAYARKAAVAFDEADGLATRYPRKAAANAVMRNAVAAADAARRELEVQFASLESTRRASR